MYVCMYIYIVPNTNLQFPSDIGEVSTRTGVAIGLLAE